MGVIEAPQWLVPAFTRSAKAVGATVPKDQIESVAESLIASWSSPDRFHHAIKHLVDVLASIDQLAEETHDPDVVRIAGWYHGAEFTAVARASYAHKGGEDTIASAERARRELPELGISDKTVERVATMISQIHRHSASTVDVDAQALSDADLAGLACEPQKYAAYRKNIRAEYAHIPAEDYLEARIAILRKLLSRAQIFCSPMGRSWEEPARENITAELAKLSAELERVEASSQGPNAADTSGAADAPVPEGQNPPRSRRDELSPGSRFVDDSTSTLGRSPRPSPRS